MLYRMLNAPQKTWILKRVKWRPNVWFDLLTSIFMEWIKNVFNNQEKISDPLEIKWIKKKVL